MTCKEIYDLTMTLMDEMLDNPTPESDPNVDYPSTPDYQARTPGILTILCTEVVRFLRAKGVDIDYLDRFENMSDEVDLEDGICQDILPYGLAARLLGQEDRRMSAYFSDLYLNGLGNLVESSDDKPKGKQLSGINIYGFMEAGD